MFVAHVEYCIATINNKKHVYVTHYLPFALPINLDFQHDKEIHVYSMMRLTKVKIAYSLTYFSPLLLL